MAELGIIAAITQIADVGLRLSIKLYTFGEIVASADRSVISISKDVSLTSGVLKELGQILAKDRETRTLSENAVQTADGIVKECLEVFQEMETILVKKLPSLGGRGKEGRGERVKRATVMLERLKWGYLQPKLQLLRSNLDRLKSTLLLMLNVITYAEQVSEKTESPSVIAEQRSLIEDLAYSNQEYIRKFERLNLGIEGLAVEHAEDFPKLGVLESQVSTEMEPLPTAPKRKFETMNFAIAETPLQDKENVWGLESNEPATATRSLPKVQSSMARSPAIPPNPAINNLFSNTSGQTDIVMPPVQEQGIPTPEAPLGFDQEILFKQLKHYSTLIQNLLKEVDEAQYKITFKSRLRMKGGIAGLHEGERRELEKMWGSTALQKAEQRLDSIVEGLGELPRLKSFSMSRTSLYESPYKAGSIEASLFSSGEPYADDLGKWPSLIFHDEALKKAGAANIQKSHANSSNRAPAAPTTSHAPFSFGGQSPQGIPQIYGPTKTELSLVLPKGKKRKPNSDVASPSTPAQAPTPAAANQLSPVGKTDSPMNEEMDTSAGSHSAGIDPSSTHVGGETPRTNLLSHQSSIGRCQSFSNSGLPLGRKDRPLSAITVDDPNDKVGVKRARNTVAARKSRAKSPAMIIPQMVQAVSDSSLRSSPGEQYETVVSQGRNLAAPDRLAAQQHDSAMSWFNGLEAGVEEYSPPYNSDLNNLDILENFDFESYIADADCNFDPSTFEPADGTEIQSATEPEGPFAGFQGYNVVKGGMIEDKDGNKVGELIYGNVEELVGQTVREDGYIVNQYGNILGRVALYEELGEELAENYSSNMPSINPHCRSPQDTTSDGPLLRCNRPVYACQRCRSAGIKCDGKLPTCTACEEAMQGAECTSCAELTKRKPLKKGSGDFGSRQSTLAVQSLSRGTTYKKFSDTEIRHSAGPSHVIDDSPRSSSKGSCSSSDYRPTLDIRLLDMGYSSSHGGFGWPRADSWAGENRLDDMRTADIDVVDRLVSLWTTVKLQ